MRLRTALRVVPVNNRIYSTSKTYVPRDIDYILAAIFNFTPISSKPNIVNWP